MQLPFEPVFLVYFFALFLCIGSFLNALAWRIIASQSMLGRSACISCRTKIAWYDLVPVLSWIMLLGKCRACRAPISLLYPFIELLTAILLIGMLLFIPSTYWLAYTLFICALIVTIRTDFEFMLIARLVTLYLLPLGWILSYFNLLPISFIESFISSFIGYGFIWLFAYIFYKLRKIKGMGEGDFELLAFIGAFTGIYGIWAAITAGSLLGSLYGILVAIKHKSSLVKIPFGPFLAAGSLIFIFWAQ